jgi:tetratricopeptide (TPR) repeat protein
MQAWRGVRLSVLVVVVLVLQGAAPARAVAAADENLFLVHLLGETYSSWPPAGTNRAALASWLASTRQRTVALRGLIKANGLDPDVGRLYEECQQFLDVYEAWLTNLGAIERRTSNQANVDFLSSLWTGYRTGSSAQEDAERLGAKKEDAEGFGALMGLIDGVGEAYERSQQRTAAQQAAIAAEKRKVDSAWGVTDASARQTVRKLTARHGWQAGEAGFDAFTSRQLGDHVTRRPRDPFVLLRYATTRVANEKPRDILADAERSARAAQLVPSPPAYDAYRTAFLSYAAHLALLAVNGEVDSYTSGPGTMGARALQMAEAYLASDRSDPGGQAHAQLARALAFSHRYDEAIAAANVASKSLGTDAGFRFRYARLMSLTNRLDSAEEWLRASFQAGFTGVNDLRRSRDFAAFRTGRAQRFAQLTTPTVSYKIHFDLLLDDLQVTNTSPFVLTGVTGTVFIRQGEKTWNPRFTCARIEIGQMCQVDDVASIPGNRYDEIKLTYTCDQADR